MAENTGSYNWSIIISAFALILSFFTTLYSLFFAPKRKYKQELKIEVIKEVFPYILRDFRVTIENTRKTYDDYYVGVKIFPYIEEIRRLGKIESIILVDEKMYNDINSSYVETTDIIALHLDKRSNFKRKLREVWGDYLSSHNSITFNIGTFIGWINEPEYHIWADDKSKITEMIKEGYDKMHEQSHSATGLTQQNIDDMTEIAGKLVKESKEYKEQIETKFIEIETEIIPKIEGYLRKPV